MGPPPASKRFFRGFRHAWHGLVYITRTQPNWRVHLAAAALASGAGYVLGLPLGELAILALAVGLVLAAEAANTAVEAAVDASGQPPSPAAKHAKDAAAGSVLIAAIISVVVAVLLFGPRLLTRLASG